MGGSTRRDNNGLRGGWRGQVTGLREGEDGKESHRVLYATTAGNMDHPKKFVAGMLGHVPARSDLQVRWIRLIPQD